MYIRIPEQMNKLLYEIPNKKLETDTYKQLETDTYNVYVNARTGVLSAFYCAKRITRLVTKQFYRLHELDSYKILSNRTY
jgi:hypothetical protein